VTEAAPRVSVVVTAYNDLRFLDAAVGSILAQRRHGGAGRVHHCPLMVFRFWSDPNRFLTLSF